MDKIKSIVKKVMVNIKEHGIIHTGKKSYQAVKRRLSAKHNPKNTYHNSNYQANESFSEYNTDIKPICFYLPQFHTFKENDEWWGKGFMEWTNTKKAYPRYLHHYQPREPHNDIGYYTLDNAETIRKQVALAKEHGIYGFCFYYYWFSGKRLMEKPLDIFLQNKDIDMNFCICWANENWTRTWDGAEHNILIKQDYSEKDKVEFVKDCLKYIQDDRYIKVNGKPVILVCNKADNMSRDKNDIYEFYNLGMGDVYPVSAANALGIGDVLDAIYEKLPEKSNDEDDERIKVAVIGKPNVGKSSLINKILGENRTIVSNIAGTTRDAIDTEYENNHGKYVLIDTAGIRRKSKVTESIEKFSIMRTLLAIERADVCLMMIDANDGVTDQDAKIAGEAMRTKNDMFYLSLAIAKKAGKISLDDIKKILNDKFNKDGLNFDNLKSVKFVGDGTYLEFSDKYIEIRPSGTDAKTKAYGGGMNKSDIEKFATVLGNYSGDRTQLHCSLISENDYETCKAKAMDDYLAFVEKDANNEPFVIPEYNF